MFNISKTAAHCLQKHPKCRVAFGFFSILELFELSGNTVWPLASGFFWAILGHFNKLLSTPNVNVRLHYCLRLFQWFSNTVGHCFKITLNVAFDFFSILAFSTNFNLLTCLVTLFDRKFQVLTKFPSKLFENYSKCLLFSIWFFQFWHFPPIFVLSGSTV